MNKIGIYMTENRLLLRAESSSTGEKIRVLRYKK